jgi:hypothetical protein
MAELRMLSKKYVGSVTLPCACLARHLEVRDLSS